MQTINEENAQKVMLSGFTFIWRQECFNWWQLKWEYRLQAKEHNHSSYQPITGWMSKAECDAAVTAYRRDKFCLIE